MQHRRSRLRLNKKLDQAWSIQRNLVTSLFLYEAVRTTRKNAKVVQPMIDRLIATAKKQTPHNAIRTLNAVLTDKNASKKVMEVLTKRYANRNSGFTQIVIAGARKGDGAPIVDLMLMDREMAKAAPETDKNQKKQTMQKSQKKTSAKKESSAPSDSSASSASSK
jgi:large subunit ribosomal protein L17